MCSATFRDVNIGGSRWVALASVALALVVTACSSGTDETVVPLTDPTTTSTTAPPTSAPTTTAAPTTTTPTPIVETTEPTETTTSHEDSLINDISAAEVEALLQAERTAYLDAVSADGDKSGDALASLVSPERLEFLLELIRSRSDAGVATRFGTVDSVRVVSIVEADSRVVAALACLTSDAVVYEIASGEIIDDELGYVLRLVTIAPGSSGWVITSQQRVASGTDPGTCSADQ